MRVALLHLDDALVAQGDFLEACRCRGAREVDARHLGPQLRLWSRPGPLAELRDLLRRELPVESDGLDAVFAGSGDFHHVAPMLVERAIASAAGPVTLVHFDNHPDWVRFANGLHCGSWVNEAAKIPGIVRTITIGVCSDDLRNPRRKGANLGLIGSGALELYAYCGLDGDATAGIDLGGTQWPTIAQHGDAAFLDFLDSRISTTAIYVTIDKDVLRPGDAVTNWDQGRMTLGYLLAAIERIASHRQIIGVDVVGDYSRPSYGGGIVTRAFKRGEALWDQPRIAPDRDAARLTNTIANLAILDLINNVTQ